MDENTVETENPVDTEPVSNTDAGSNTESTSNEETTPNPESILTSVKLALGIGADYPFFDDQLILYINTAIAALIQTGVGTEGFSITGDGEHWSDLLGEKMAALEYSKTYVILRVRLLFDPPQSSGALEALKETLREFEWRGYIECDPPLETEE